MPSRRKFLTNSALGLAAPGFLSSFSEPLQNSVSPAAAHSLSLGIAGYTFHRIPMNLAIAEMQQVGINALSIKDFYLPLDSSKEHTADVLGQFSAAGLSVYAVGVIYMKSTAEVDRAFDYAVRTGVPMIVGVPNPELIPYAEQKVKATNIKLAIHNHGPEDKLYPSPKDVYDHINKLDPRVGLCFDIGHGVRAGADPARAVLEYGPRILDMHIKDVTADGTGERAIQLGRGIIDFPALIKALRKINYVGRCSFEFEMDVPDPLTGLAESVGYFKGVMSTVG